MSTRKGTVILLDELINEAIERAAKVVEAKSLALTDAEKSFIAEGVALGAIKYQVLSQNRETNLTFDWDRMLSLEGNTAPYLQYSYARAGSILRKAAEAAEITALEAGKLEHSAPVFAPPAGVDESQTDLFTLVAEKIGQQDEAESSPADAQNGHLIPGTPLGHASEKNLAALLVKFSEVVEAAAETYKPNLISTYLFELSQAFNSFYQDVQVLSTTNRELRQSRLDLVAAFAQVLKNGLHLLGITVFEKM
jgi:arginyl-tRNA synthetase